MFSKKKQIKILGLNLLLITILVGCRTQSNNTQSSETVLEKDQEQKIEITGNDAVLKKACEDFAYSIPKTDPTKNEPLIPVDDVWKMDENWKNAIALEEELFLPFMYMKTYIKIVTTEPDSVVKDEEWSEDLRSQGMIPESEVASIFEGWIKFRDAINNEDNKVCANYNLFFKAPLGFN